MTTAAATKSLEPQDAIAVEFEALLPELQRLAVAFSKKCSEPQEAVAEILAFSWWNYAQAARKGVRLTPAQLFFVARRRVRSGRVFGNSESVVDVFSTQTQRLRRSQVFGLSGFKNPSRQPNPRMARRFIEAITFDHANPAEIVRVRLDWQGFRAGLSERQQVLLDGLAEGRRFVEMAERLNVSPCRINQLMPGLRREAHRYFKSALPVEYLDSEM